MTDKRDTTPNDDSIREAVANVDATPSELHDARVLAAARAAAAERRAAEVPKTRPQSAWRALAIAATLVVAVGVAVLMVSEEAIDPGAVAKHGLRGHTSHRRGPGCHPTGVFLACANGRIQLHGDRLRRPGKRTVAERSIACNDPDNTGRFIAAAESRSNLLVACRGGW